MTQAAPATRTEPAMYRRWYPLEDIQIVRSGQYGDATGRVVEAYAAVFESPAQIRDQQGEYEEVVDRGAFNRAVEHARRASGGWSTKVLFNHGQTILGTPAERFSMPVGTPLEVRPEARGLLTVTRYNATPLADEVLELIRSGGVTSQSFSGRIVRSDPAPPPGGQYHSRGGQLTRVRRTELGLREYGPCVFAAYDDAEILGVRMSTPGYDPAPDEDATRSEDPDESASGTASDEAPAADDPPASDGAHSVRHHEHELYRLRSQEQRRQRGM